MFLLYINPLGVDYKGSYQYEFIFGESTEIDVYEWHERPASDISAVPDIDDINIVGLLKDSNIQLDLIQQSDSFAIIDAVEGIVALGWESFDSEIVPLDEPRMSFHYGTSFEEIETKLMRRGYKLIIQKL